MHSSANHSLRKSLEKVEINRAGRTWGQETMNEFQAEDSLTLLRQALAETRYAAQRISCLELVRGRCTES